MPLQPDSTPEEDGAYILGLAICLLVVLVLGVPTFTLLLGE